MKLTVVGLTGPAGSGKDTVAQALISERGYKKVAFADPLYRIMKLEVAKQNGDTVAAYKLFDLILKLFGGPAYAPPLGVTAQVAESEMSRIAGETNLMIDMERGTKPRAFLQELGTEYFRAYDENIWANFFTNSVLEQVREAREDYFTALETEETLIRKTGGDTVDGVNVPEPHMRIVVTDVRFNNEPIAIQRLVELANELGPDVRASSHILKLDIPREVAVQRVSERDDIPVDAVAARMGHASEAGVDESLIDAVVDASQDIEIVVRDVKQIIDGAKPRPTTVVMSESSTMPVVPKVSGVIDLAEYAKRKDA